MEVSDDLSIEDTEVKKELYKCKFFTLMKEKYE
jgi:hypothetical protein